MLFPVFFLWVSVYKALHSNNCSLNLCFANSCLYVNFYATIDILSTYQMSNEVNMGHIVQKTIFF